MECADEIIPTFICVLATLLPGVVNNLELADYRDTFSGQSYVAPMFTSSNSGAGAFVVEISIRAENLRDRDWTIERTLICYTYLQSSNSHIMWNKIHETEIIDNDVSPIFMNKFELSSFLPENTKIKFEIYDIHNNDETDILGSTVTNLGTLMSSGNLMLPANEMPNPNLIGRKLDSNPAKIVVTAERLINNQDRMMMRISGTGLDDRAIRSRPDRYMEVFKLGSGSNPVLIYRTEIYKSEQFTVQMKSLCNGDIHRALFFVCWGRNSHEEPTLIGHFKTSLYELYDEGRTNFEIADQSSTEPQTMHIYVELDYVQGRSTPPSFQAGVGVVQAVHG